MKIIFTKSTKILSKIIMDLTTEPVSHVAIDFGWVVIQSNLLGVHIEWAKNFKKHSEVVFSLSPAKRQSHLVLANKMSKQLEKYEFSMYDYGALLFFGFSLMLRKYLKIPLPKSNLWQSSGMFICTEWVETVVSEKTDPMLTPFKLYLKLKDSGDWEDS